MENDLAYQFGISQPTVHVCRILYMDHYFDEFMPEVFKDSYRTTNLYYRQYMTCLILFTSVADSTFIVQIYTCTTLIG